ncbi:phytanoyl-CoA dioxygenase family protein [Flavobacteriaceae bacterium]|nr:phytanoyl-CoA dioxygenase family protein [Flavobacteriaceae bacterium]
MDLKKIKHQFRKNGYVLFEKFFSDELMDNYNQLILNHYGENPTWEHTDEFLKKSAVQVIPWFPYRENKPYFDGIDQDKIFNKITENLIGKDWNNLYCMMMFSKAGTIGQAWHQDCPPENKKRFNLNRLVYTHDITDETGGSIIIYPKTHHEGAITIGDPHEDIEGQVVVQPKKGTVIFLHGHCWHRVTPAKKDRISSNFRALPKKTPADITDICVYRNMRYKFSTSEIIEDRV